MTLWRKIINILLIGNDFDLAHRLPTTYKDFLLFIEVMKQVVNVTTTDDLNCIDWKNINLEIYKLIQSDMGNVKNNIYSQADTWKELIENNFWIEYFLCCQSYIKENWIDFENEISKVIQAFSECIKKIDINDPACRNTNNPFLNDFFMSDTEKIENDRLMEMEEEIKKSSLQLSVSEWSKYKEVYDKKHPLQTLPPITYKEIIKKLENDLNKLIIALEIYLADYVDKIDVKEKSPDIIKIINDEVNTCIHDKEECICISFNYTHTFSRVYGIEINDFIHGEARVDRTKAFHNMILGIDEYLDDDRKNKELDFISYKKYYQRIYKETGDLSKRHADRKKENKDRYTVYIFGHSLDVTDKDILSALIKNDNVRTYIYYHDDTAHKKLIANLVKVLGEEEVIKRTNGTTKTISFIKQQNF